ncbi:hypothetical protein SAMD00019534_015570 [Acytostelium subglobosum LB1]|uniref:hypothetical protein n=1 Tax=Acytostelium subglobosum LB1 TaxID=1410327 RepID=UPI000644DA18|nr:hypothetical protein SAMD00019534_015570 [Acytostelium subglobosum LB1]GAM18382.1 hypothetical protein SAMD00019534_015570 [Acytostelium subglobosum LB1]|eukprot:XP_012757602.1 hypothetical protein SAMD00019534_015570 [Acytostelium subglobosum LB1]
MGGIKKFKKNEKGENIRFITRNAAARKLQVSLNLFRKLCILKGIHPRDPKKRLHGKNKTYYYTKDIRFLQHEPLIQLLRDRKTFAKREKRLKEKKDFAALEQFIKSRPNTSIDHIVRERYPSFQDAIKDLDDCLTLVHLFASMDSSPKVRENHILACATLCREFQTYVTKAKCLRKVFVSIKGIYYQAEIMGETVTWLTPINYINKKEKAVDYGVMISFLEFYEVMLRFVNYRLYNSIGLKYPPTVDMQRLNNGDYLSAMITETSTTTTTTTTTTSSKKQPQLSKEEMSKQKEINELSKTFKEADDEDDEDEEDTTGGKLELTSKGISKDFEDLVHDGEQDDTAKVGQIIDVANLFRGLKFFVSRECPKHALEFVITSFGGEVSWEGGAFSEGDQTITHQIVDRNAQNDKIHHNREYVQPQWVFDSVNTKILLDVTEYKQGSIPPPHLSPFVEYDEDSYIPARKAVLDELIGQKGFGDAKVPTTITDIMTQDDEDEDDEEEKDSDEESDDDDDIAAIESRYMRELKTEENKKRKAAEADDEDNEDEEDEEIEDVDDNEVVEDSEDSEDEAERLQKAKLKKKQSKEKEELQMAEMMIRKKDRWLYNRIKSRNEAADRHKNKLITKRDRVEKGQTVDGIPKSEITRVKSSVHQNINTVPKYVPKAQAEAQAAKPKTSSKPAAAAKPSSAAKPAATPSKQSTTKTTPTTKPTTPTKKQTQTTTSSLPKKAPVAAASNKKQKTK